MTARYWIAQYVSDPFRNEPRNIGVFVEVDGSVTTRFVGEDESGDLDGRTIRHSFQFPDVYKQWVRYWRKASRNGPLTKLVEASAANFRVHLGGEVSDTACDSSKQVADYLYSMLVSKNGFMEALGPTANEETAHPGLDVELSNAFDDANILSRDDADGLVPHPIRSGVPVLGRHLAKYVPAFVQKNGHLVVIETVDFTKRYRHASRDHAGWSAYMFHDVRGAQAGTETIAVVRVTDEDAETDDVRNGLSLLRNESEVVNWLDTDERSRFLNERRDVAFS